MLSWQGHGRVKTYLVLSVESRVRSTLTWEHHCSRHQRPVTWRRPRLHREAAPATGQGLGRVTSFSPTDRTRTSSSAPRLDSAKPSSCWNGCERCRYRLRQWSRNASSMPAWVKKDATEFPMALFSRIWSVKALFDDNLSSLPWERLHSCPAVKSRPSTARRLKTR